MVGLVGALAVLPVRAERTPVLMMPDAIEGTRVFVALPPDAIPAIDAPTFLRGPSAARQMTADEPVLGVRLAGEARAYPLGLLSSHEIVNDWFGETPVAVTR